MGVLIDASALIDAERGRVDIAGKIKGHEQEEFFISVITASELLHGVWRAKGSAIRARRSAFVEGVLERFPILPVDLSVARIHSQLLADLEHKGISLGPHDRWLAATCVAYGHTLATGDVEAFKKVPGLNVDRW